MKTKKQRFYPPIIGIEDVDGITVCYNEYGDYSVILKMDNPIVQYSAETDLYYAFHDVFINILKILGKGYCIHKDDIFCKQNYHMTLSENTDYLSKRYFEHFEGREYKKQLTYLTIGKEITRNKTKLFTYNPKEFVGFVNNVNKVMEFLQNKGYSISMLNKEELDEYIYRYLTMNFTEKKVFVNNFKVNKEEIEIGNKIIRNVSLVDIDEVNFPPLVRPYKHNNVGIGYSSDTMDFLHRIPDTECVIYSQTIIIPDQQVEIAKLEAKKKKHSSMPDPANQLSVQDIDNVMVDIVKGNQLLVYANYNIIMLCENDIAMNKAYNYLESALFDINIFASKQCNNQLELFRSSMPGNSFDIAEYDRFLTTSDTAICLFYKERPQITEDSPFLTYFTDRNGIPIGIDVSGKEGEKKLTNNSNFFVLGPSGSGKSFYVNSKVRQWVLENTDIVLVDTGHSYSGLCNYYNGKYITYTEQKPITMNPFRISKGEYNEEKVDFLKSLVILIWKGSDAVADQIEDTLLTNIISSYYKAYWNKDERQLTAEEKEVMFENDIEHSKETAIIETLNFNTFFEFSIGEIKRTMEHDHIKFNLNDFIFILRKFYKGGKYEKILNDDFDSTLFDETFIVFEIDSIKENKTLFPIVTLIIMDVFLQKMRLKKNRKALIIEEAWKAIASPTMANYILYLYKTVRKFWGMAMVVTQELEDIIGNAVVKNSIINNSDIVCLLDQTKFRDNYQEIADLLSLNDTEQKKIFTINKLNNKEGRSRFNEVYIKRGSEGQVYGVEVSKHEYFTFTTERIEKDALSYYQSVYTDYKTSLDTFIDDMKASKLKQNEWIRAIAQTFKDMPESELKSLSAKYPTSLKDYILYNYNHNKNEKK